jgi:RAD51-like protein 2
MSMTDRIIDLPLSHLPLRPSSLEALLAAGFGRVVEVQESFRAGGIVNFSAELGISTEAAYSIYREVVAVSSSGFNPEVFPNKKSHDVAVRSCNSAADLLERQRGRSGGHIITFCRALDEILSGGIAIGELTEIAGAPGAGKTAMSMQLAVNASLPVAVSGVAGSTIYVDTEGSFSPERCHCMATHLINHIQAGLQRRQKQQTMPHSGAGTTSTFSSGWSVTAEDILSNIHIYRAHDVSDLSTLLSGALPDLIEQLSTTSQPVRLVVIDSLAFPFRAADPESTDFVVRTRQLTTMANSLSMLAATYQLAAVAVNQMTTKFSSSSADGLPQAPDGSSIAATSATKLVPALGESWAHAVTTRLVLSCENQQQRYCSLTKSPRFPTASAQFEIIEAGVRGVDHTSAKKQRKSEWLSMFRIGK